MPSFSATDRAPATAGTMPLATTASHPSAAAVTVPNQAAISSAARRGTSAIDGGAAPCTSARTPSAASGSMPPRESYVDNSTRTS